MTAIDAQLAEVVSRQEAQSAHQGRPSLADRRHRHESQVRCFTPREARPPVGSVEDLEVEGSVVPVPVRVYRPLRSGEDRCPTMVWIHGGGWVTGSLETADVMAREVCAAGMVVVSVDYRLAPEAKFPAGLDDCTAVVRWAARRIDYLGGDVTRLGVGGDSAGGNLAAVLAQMEAELEVTLAVQLLIYPVMDLRGGIASYASRHENSNGPLLTMVDLEWTIGQYLAAGSDASDPKISPITQTEMASVPSAVIMTAELDPLRDEGESYAHGLRRARVPVILHRAPGMTHCVVDLLAAVPAARALVKSLLADTVRLLDTPINARPGPR